MTMMSGRSCRVDGYPAGGIHRFEHLEACVLQQVLFQRQAVPVVVDD